jgi:putative tryptophan/tyrosine transport system substrate-binding protein
MRRREFITLVGGAVASPLVARAQQPAKTKRIAIVSAAEPASQMVASYNPIYRGFFDELSRHGLVEGKHLVIERYSAEGDTDRFPQLVRDIVAARPDAICSAYSQITLLFKSTKTTIPIVTIGPDPVALGLAQSISHPGGNITGVTIDAGLEIWGKRIGLIKEVLPKLSNLALILPLPPKLWEGSPYSAVFRQAAKSANIALTPALLDGKIDADTYRRVFISFAESKPDALLITESSINAVNSVTLIELAAKNRLPAMYTWREHAENGGLMSHSFDLEELGRSCGYQMAQVVSGSNPGDIPFIQVTRLYLTLNLKTAKSLGIEFPATLLGSADFIIE